MTLLAFAAAGAALAQTAGKTTVSGGPKSYPSQVAQLDHNSFDSSVNKVAKRSNAAVSRRVTAKIRAAQITSNA